MNKDLIAIFEYLEKEKGIKRDLVIHAIEESLQAAARKSVSGASNATVKIHPKTGNIDVFCEKEIVDEVEVDSQEISLENARKLDPDCDIGQFIDVVVTPDNFGRIAAQKARQILTQKLRFAERDVIYEGYRHRVGEIVSGTVKKFVRGSNLLIDLGKVEALMPTREYPITEKYFVGDKVLAILMEVKEAENGGAEVILSRSSPDFVRELLTQEVPELSDGTIEITKIVREAGYRTKLIVKSSDFKIDPVGACVGVRGNRIKNVVRELHNEKIDIIPHASSLLEQLQNILSPIEIRKININDEEGTISIVVDDESFPAVIGKRGMNARLTGKLTGMQFEAQRLSDYNNTMAIMQEEWASSTDDLSLDQPIESVEGLNNLIVDNLISEGFITVRDLLRANAEQLSSIPGVDKVLEQIRKQRK